MGTTLIQARERDERVERGVAARVRRVGSPDALLVATSLVAVLAIGLAYAGQRYRAAITGTTGAPGAPAAPLINLSTVETAREIEPALDAVRAAPADRAGTARTLFQIAGSRRAESGDIANVDAVLAASVEAEDGASRRRVLTATEVAALKPSFAVRTWQEYARALILWSALYMLGFHLVVVLWRLRAEPGDRLLLSAAHLLTGLGFAAVVSAADPLRDTLFFVRYASGVLVGLAVMAAISLVDFRKTAFSRFSYVPLLGALLLSVVLILFGWGPGSSGAKVNLGGVQPIEAIRLLLSLFLAGYFARRWELLRQVGARSYTLPVVAGVGAALLFFFLQKDLGPALFLSCVFLVLYAVARGRVVAAASGVAVLALGFYAGYELNVSSTLAARVQMWQSPWDNAVRGGDQVAQAVWALATGGTFGTGLGLGDIRYLPAGRTDLPLAAIGEELGFAGLFMVLTVYAVMSWRGFRIGLKAANDYGFFLATAVTLFLVTPVAVMMAGILGVIPLTGVATPFLSYGGSAMTANFAALGILAAIRSTGRSVETAEPFEKPMKILGASLGAGALALTTVLLSVQVLRADTFIVKPQFSTQADGIGRFQYNPRIAAALRDVPRGSVFDRNGIVLSTGDAAIAAKAGTAYQRLGVETDATCVEPIARCYPLGGMAFHLLGEAPSRRNWSANNTSYIERDAEDRLRGFDDHSTLVRLTDRSGKQVSALRRDYSDLIPLMRHRYDPQDSSVRQFFARDRDVRLTIDARFQVRVAKILERAAKQSATGKAAAVVLDPDSGELLALASYPWPAPGDRAEGDGEEADAFLDRARYGLYPPGSTFKLVTAVAALRKDPGLQSQAFACGLLPDGRVGTRIPGSRVVRDDVKDKTPHGTIAMHDGMVESCNAYFAQLAMTVGPDALLETANLLGISVSPAGSTDRLRATLPQAGYGQGDVLVSPLRMARVVAALASDGILREPTFYAAATNPAKAGSHTRETASANPAKAGSHTGETASANPAKAGSHTTVLLPPSGARLLAGYMRDVVLSGTGRVLASNPGRIAGKTGTAEVAGAASHSWFAGYAPYGAPTGKTKRIAFAVIVENAGYGSLAGAPVAGEIVSAALATGLIGGK